MSNVKYQCLPHIIAMVRMLSAPRYRSGIYCWRRSTRETRSPALVWNTPDTGRMRVPLQVSTEAGPDSHKTDHISASTVSSRLRIDESYVTNLIRVLR